MDNIEQLSIKISRIQRHIDNRVEWKENYIKEHGTPFILTKGLRLKFVNKMIAMVIEEWGENQTNPQYSFYLSEKLYKLNKEKKGLLWQLRRDIIKWEKHNNLVTLETCESEI